MKAFFSFVFSGRMLLLYVVLAVLAGAGFYLYTVETANAAGPGFRTDAVVKKNLSATITATGTLEPEEVIDIGAQVAGLVLKFGPADPAKPDGPPVDYCTAVKKGQPLAYIDPTLYEAQVKLATAALNVAKASLASAQANVAKSKANRDALLDTYQRDRASPAAIAQGQIVTDQGAYQVAAADYTLQQAGVQQAQASIDQATANLQTAQTNLGYCTIVAPVDGVIVDRRVSVGQTVVSSLSAPSLFLLAKDLMRMQVWASVNEADIGNIHIGQDVTFTVDARPNHVFQGEVVQIRLNASMTQNVVTYTVVVATTNRMIDVPSPTKRPKKPGTAAKVATAKTPDQASGASDGKTHSEDPLNTTPVQELELLPYLTANLTFHVANRENALLVPNAALRWRPQLQQVDPAFRDEYEQSLRRKATKSSDANDPTAAKAAGPGGNKPGKTHDQEGGAASHGMVWVQVPGSNYVRPIKIVSGLTDGAMTEVVSVHEGETLDEGTTLVIGENAVNGAAATTNPFAPKLPFGRQQKKPAQ